MTAGDWSSFFSAQTAAFAALTGLVFVALSINLRTILNLPGTSGRAGEALIVLIEPVLLGLAGLVAHQSTTALGVEWLTIGLLGWMAVTAILAKGRTVIGERPKHQVLIRIAGPQAATLLLVVAGALLAAGAVDGLYWQAAGVAACLVVGIADAWVLLVEILR